MIRAIVLAAGESRRMGMPKPLLRFGDTTFLGQIVGVLRECDVDATTVVLGSQAEAIRAATDLSDVNVVINENYRDGQLSSLVAGLSNRGAGVPPLGPGGILSAEKEQGQDALAAKEQGQDALATKEQGQDALATEEQGQDALATKEQGQDALATEEAILLCLVDNPFITVDVVGRIIEEFRRTHKPIVIPVFNGRRGHPTLFARAVFDELLHAPANEGARRVVHADRTRILEVEIAEEAILARIDTPEDYASYFGAAPQIREGR